MLENLTLFLIMHLCIKMRLLALGNQLMLTNKSGKVVAKYVGGKHKSSKTCVGYPRCLFLTSKDPRLFGYPRTRPKLFCRFMHPGVQVG
jgi:hypothetical protein